MPTKSKHALQSPILWVFLLTAMVLAAMTSSFQIGRNMAERHVPLTNASAKIKYEVTLAHLWFEEIISGDRFIAIDKVWEHLLLARQYALAMLGDSESQIKHLKPLENQLLRMELENTLSDIDNFRAIAEQRWNARALSGIGSENDQLFDRRFEELLSSIEVVEQQLEQALQEQLENFKTIQQLLVFWVLILGIGTAYLLYRHDRQRGKDLAKLKDREEKLLVNEQRYRALFERSNDAIFLVGKANGCYLDANQAALKLTGRSLHELVNLRTSDIAENPEQARARLEQYADNTSAEAVGIVTYVRPDRTVRTAQLSVVPLDDHSLFGIARDITEEQETEQQLRRAQKMEAIGQLTGGIAHDFNNILGIILGNVDLLEHKYEEKAKIPKQLVTIKRSAERASKLTKQLLGFSRNQAQEITVVDLNKLIDEMTSLIQRTVTPSIEVVYKLEPTLSLTNIDAEDFKDALLNLVLNARDAMHDNGRLLIETSNTLVDEAYCIAHPAASPGAYLACSIGDNGIGMSAEQQEHIFEPFYTTKEPGKGTGLGLSMVFGFVKRSGGHIEVNSAIGSGTTFTLFLPISSAVEIAHPADEESPLLRSGHDELILVVDDEKELLQLAESLLQELGYRSLCAKDAREALEILQNEPRIALLFSDVLMPGDIDGYQLASQAVQIHPHLKVLLTSGFNPRLTQNHSSIQQQYPLLKKPYSRLQLSEQIRKLLDSTPKKG